MRINRLQLKRISVLLIASLAWIAFVQTAAAQTPPTSPLVQAVLFFRSSCSHCVQLVTEVMPPILDKYGDQLQVFYCDVSTPAGDALFTAAIDHFKIKTIGVPTVIVGKDVLIGSVNIQQQFPGIIDAGLTHGGLSWPDIPGLSQACTAAGSMQLPVFAPPGSYFSSVPTPLVAGPTAEPQVSNASPLKRIITEMGNNFGRDPSGNSFSVIVLTSLLGSVFYGIYAFLKKPAWSFGKQPPWIVPLLALLGCAVAGYLAYVELTYANAICGPVGNCQTVQESVYSRLFGLIPLGLLGLTGFGGVLLLWFIRRFSNPKWIDLASLFSLGITAAGLLFSIYLTFLEPFVIGATCIWCLSSAILMAVLMLLSIAPAKLAVAHLRQNKRLWS
jgi:uncharacterized membrane protein